MNTVILCFCDLLGVIYMQEIALLTILNFLYSHLTKLVVRKGFQEFLVQLGSM